MAKPSSALPCTPSQEPPLPPRDNISDSGAHKFNPYHPASGFGWALNANLCDYCRKVASDILSGWQNCRSGWAHDGKAYRKWLQVIGTTSRSTSNNRCTLCAAISQELLHDDHNRLYAVYVDGGKDGRFFVSPSADRVTEFRLFTNNVLSGPPATGVAAERSVGCLWVRRSAFSDDARLETVPADFAYTGETIARAQQWYSDCSEKHNHCSKGRSGNCLPKRVLDLNVSQDKVALYVTKGETEPYATLSYCWGLCNSLMTTSSNFDRHCNGILLDQFPETLKDAILVARSLNFRYLWIDALCIVQGDALDWVEQAAAMTEIYQGCSLNICASDSPNGNSGMVRKLQNYAFQIGTYSPAPGLEEPLGELLAFSVPASNIHKEDHRPHGRLSTRGWVLQETLVSPASLYYTVRGLKWECRTTRMNEFGAAIKNEEGHPTGETRLKEAWIPFASSSNSASSEGDCGDIRLWYYIIRAYSDKRLTLRGDKLPAIAGIARRLSQELNSSYVAGLWKEHLITGLTWIRGSPKPLKRYKDRAPSWSWASVDGPLTYLWFLFPESKYSGLVPARSKQGVQINDVIIQEVYPGSFGEVYSGGRIEATGLIQEIVMEDNRVIEGFACRTYYELECSLDEEPDPSGRYKLWCLRLASLYASGASSKRRGPYICFLLLEKTGVRENEFRRVGFAFRDYSPRYYVPEKVPPGAFASGSWCKITLV